MYRHMYIYIYTQTSLSLSIYIYIHRHTYMTSRTKVIEDVWASFQTACDANLWRM